MGNQLIDLPSESTGIERFDVPGGAPIDITIYRLDAERWPKRVDFVVGSYTNKVLIERAGEPVFPEIALVQIAREQGWEAAWIDTYPGDRCWSDMPERSQPIVLPPRQQQLLAAIEARAGRGGGCWDVLIWKDETSMFIESKSTDRVHETQRVWFAAAIAAGIPSASFAIAEWSVTGSVDHRQAERQPKRKAPARRRLPIEKELQQFLPGPYREKAKRVGLSLVSDNTLRRIRAGSSTYPSRVEPLRDRDLVTEDGGALTEFGAQSLETLDPLLPIDGYPKDLLN